MQGSRWCAGGHCRWCRGRRGDRGWVQPAHGASGASRDAQRARWGQERVLQGQTLAQRRGETINNGKRRKGRGGDSWSHHSAGATSCEGQTADLPTHCAGLRGILRCHLGRAAIVHTATDITSLAHSFHVHSVAVVTLVVHARVHRVGATSGDGNSHSHTHTTTCAGHNRASVNTSPNATAHHSHFTWPAP